MMDWDGSWDGMGWDGRGELGRSKCGISRCYMFTSRKHPKKETYDALYLALPRGVCVFVVLGLWVVCDMRYTIYDMRYAVCGVVRCQWGGVGGGVVRADGQTDERTDGRTDG
jgi:hypothetical protein